MEMNLAPTRAQAMLAAVIAEGIKAQTSISPMDVEQIIAVLGLVAGASIANNSPRGMHKHLRDTVVANLDNTLSAMSKRGPSSSIILPAANRSGIGVVS